MILSTHAIVGGAIASLCPSQLAAVVGFGSHFAIDAIPHWDYQVRSIAVGRGADNRGLRLDRAALVDLPFIGTDACVGLGLALWLFPTADSMYVIALGAMAAMIADPLQFVHSLLPREPLSTLQRFHEWMHSKRRLTLEWGLSSQIASLLVSLVARGFAA